MGKKQMRMLKSLKTTLCCVRRETDIKCMRSSSKYPYETMMYFLKGLEKYTQPISNEHF